MPRPFPIFTQSDCLIQVVDSHTESQTVQIQISWLLQKPTDLDLHCLQRQGISGLSRTRVKIFSNLLVFYFYMLKVLKLSVRLKSVLFQSLLKKGGVGGGVRWGGGGEHLSERIFPILRINTVTSVAFIFLCFFFFFFFFFCILNLET